MIRLFSGVAPDWLHGDKPKCGPLNHSDRLGICRELIGVPCVLGVAPRAEMLRIDLLLASNTTEEERKALWEKYWEIGQRYPDIIFDFRIIREWGDE